MLFAVTYANAAHGDEARDRRTNKMLATWKPPAGFEFKCWYDYADGSGGIAIVETPSAELLMDAIAPWATFFDFSAKPIVASETSAQILVKAVAWRDALK